MHSKLWSLALFGALASAQKTLIPTNSFSSLDTYWNYLYPDGSDHNGGARMDKAHTTVKDGVLTLTAEKVSGEPPSKFGDGTIPINYRSGAVHSKQTFTVAKGGGLDFSGEFKAPIAKGTWPAFWLTGAESWPPEIDIAEWMGDGNILFNTYNTSTNPMSKSLPYINQNNWHKVQAEIRDENGSDVSVKFYMDGTAVDTQYGSGFVGKPLNL